MLYDQKKYDSYVSYLNGKQKEQEQSVNLPLDLSKNQFVKKRVDTLRLKGGSVTDALRAMREKNNMDREVVSIKEDTHPKLDMEFSPVNSDLKFDDHTLKPMFLTNTPTPAFLKTPSLNMPILKELEISEERFRPINIPDSLDFNFSKQSINDEINNKLGENINRERSSTPIWNQYMKMADGTETDVDCEASDTSINSENHVFSEDPNQIIEDNQFFHSISNILNDPEQRELNSFMNIRNRSNSNNASYNTQSKEGFNTTLSTPQAHKEKQLNLDKETKEVKDGSIVALEELSHGVVMLNNAAENIAFNKKNSSFASGDEGFTCLSYQKDYIRADISNKSKRIINDAAIASGNKSVSISSGFRDSRSQAEEMFNDCNSNKRISYSKYGREVQNIFYKSKEEGIDSDETIIDKMENQIIEFTNNGNYVSNHCVKREEFDKVNTIDISIKHGLETSVIDFIFELAKNPSVRKILHPIPKIQSDKDERGVIKYDKGEKCIHVEIEQ